MKKLLLFVFCGASLVWAQTSPVLRTDTSQTITSKTIAGASNDLSLRFHATDCTSLGDGIEGEVCYEQDANSLYVCEPSAGACDTAPEWIGVSVALGADSVGTAEIDDGADTPLAGEWLQVDNDDQAGVTYRTDAEALSDLGIPFFQVAGPAQNRTYTFPDSAQTIEYQANKDAASGYAALDGSSKLTASVAEEVISLHDLDNATEASSTDNDLWVYVTDHWENQTIAEAGVQPSDAELTGLAGLSGTGVVIHTGAGTFIERTLTGSSNEVVIADGTGVSGNPAFTLGSKVTQYLTADDSAIDFASVADGASSTTAETVTVTGAAVGNMCSVAPTTNILSVGVTIECWVSAADTVSYFVRNDSGSAEDLASATYRAVVVQAF